MLKKAAVLFLTAFFCFLLVSVIQTSRVPGSLLIAVPALPQPGELLQVPDSETGGFLPNVYEGLVRFKPGSCEVLPHLATEWRLSPDGRTWTFKLRHGVRFHNGQVLNAALVKEAFNQKLQATTRFPHFRFLFGMIQGITVPDPMHISFRLKYPYTPFLRNLALPQAAISIPGTPPAGTGPYRIEAIKRNKITLRAFNRYRGQKPAFETVCLQAVPDANKRLNLLKKKARVIALNLPPAATRSLPPSTITRTTAPSLSYLGFYTSKPPFDNPAARRTAALALDRNRLCYTLYDGLLLAAKGPLPPVVFSSDPKVSSPPPDRAKACDLARTTGLKGRSLTLLTYTGTRPYNPAGGTRLAAEVKRQLETAGLKVNIRYYPWEDLKAAIARQEGDAFLYGWVSDNGDPDNFFCLLSGSPIARRLNTTRYRNPVLEALLARGQQLPDSPVRAKIYREAQAIVTRDFPFVSLNYGAHIAACTPELEGFILYPLGTYDLAKIKQRQH